MIKKVFLVSAAAVTLLLSACLSEVPLNHESYTEGLTVEQVRQAVLDGAKVRGWKTEQVKPGFIVATYTKDKKTNEKNCKRLIHVRRLYKRKLHKR